MGESRYKRKQEHVQAQEIIQRITSITSITPITSFTVSIFLDFPSDKYATFGQGQGALAPGISWRQSSKELLGLLPL